MHPIVTTDPAAYVQDLDGRIAEHGMAAIRDVSTAMFGEIPPQFSALMLAYEGYVGHAPAQSWQVVDDITLANRVRSIYSLHIYSSHQLLFTRADFVRVDNSNWSMTGVSFGSSWAQIVTPTTPGFSETPRSQ